jgi:hypothetical protein
MNRISDRFLRLGVLCGLIGMLMGIAMAATHDHALMPAHAHLNLLGWVSLLLYGLAYRLLPDAAASRLAGWHFRLAALGLAFMVPGLVLLAYGHPAGEPAAIIGSVLTVAAMVLFAVVLMRATGASRETA